MVFKVRFDFFQFNNLTANVLNMPICRTTNAPQRWLGALMGDCVTGCVVAGCWLAWELGCTHGGGDVSEG